MPDTNRPGTRIFKYIMPEHYHPVLKQLAQEAGEGTSMSDLIDIALENTYSITRRSKKNA